MKQFQFIAHLKDFNPIIRKRKELIQRKRKSRGFGELTDNPITIQDKLHWLMLYDNTNQLKSLCADKYRVREYVKEVLGKDICVPLIAVYDNTNQIDWNKLPNQFVMKCNHGYHMNIICKSKNNLDKKKAIENLNKWMNQDFGHDKNNIEFHYSDIKRNIIVEQYLNDGHDDLIDYKFHCFNGNVKFCEIFSDRNNSLFRANLYDMNFNNTNIGRTDIKPNKNIEDIKPKNFELMKEYAKKLSAKFKFVRVDFYEVNEEVYLGELTFTPAVGFFRYDKKEDEIKMGNFLDLN